jgi:hypothetical protein
MTHAVLTQEQFKDRITERSSEVIADNATRKVVKHISHMEFNPVLNAELDRLMKTGATHREAAALIEKDKRVLAKARAWERGRSETPKVAPQVEDTEPEAGSSDDAMARELYATALALREVSTPSDVLNMHPTYRGAIAALAAKPSASYEDWLTSLVRIQPGGTS